MNAIEQSFPVELFIMLHKVVLTFESGDKIDPKGHICLFVCLFVSFFL